MKIEELDWNHSFWIAKSEVRFDVKVSHNKINYRFDEVLPLDPIIDFKLLEMCRYTNIEYIKNVGLPTYTIKINYDIVIDDYIVEIYRPLGERDDWHDPFYLKLNLYDYLECMINYARSLLSFFQRLFSFIKYNNPEIINISEKILTYYNNYYNDIITNIHSRYSKKNHINEKYFDNIDLPSVIGKGHLKDLIISLNIKRWEEFYGKIKHVTFSIDDYQYNFSIQDENIIINKFLIKYMHNFSHEIDEFIIESPHILNDFKLQKKYFDELMGSKYHNTKSICIKGMEDHYIEFEFEDWLKDDFSFSTYRMIFNEKESNYQIIDYYNIWSLALKEYLTTISSIEREIKNGIQS